jgi:hypothetical protein
MCTLCGCKTATVEAWAKPGNWVIGIGGKGTGKPDALIYVLKADTALTLEEFSQNSPSRASYLTKRSFKPFARVLVGHHFYYLGDKAVLLPPPSVPIMLRHLTPVILV